MGLEAVLVLQGGFRDVSGHHVGVTMSGAMSRLPTTRSITVRPPTSRPIAPFSSYGKRRRN
jgi:hypothetical protein